MNTQNRRFVFIDFENLRKIKFKKLEKVATKIFVFINDDVDHIPAFLVYQIQKLGKDVKWIVVENPQSNRMNYHIAFLMGKLHQKLHADVEFAVLSNDKNFDSLISFINGQGRNCIRVKRKKTREEKVSKVTNPTFAPTIAEPLIQHQEELAFDTNGKTNGHKELFVRKEAKKVFSPIEKEYDHLLVEKTADETMERLVRSGNRPAELNTLKDYILLNNQELSIHGNINQVIERMEATNNIEIEAQGSVIYHF